MTGCHSLLSKPLIIGLTGGIASGKSTVSATFTELGASIVDTDVIARQVVLPGSAALTELIAVFGASVCLADGSLDRRGLRERVFSDADAKGRLEAILHPRIRAQARKQVESAQGDYVVLVVPLLVESGRQYDWVDRILVVDIPHQQQLRLLMQRDDVSVDLASAMMTAQADRGSRLTIADDVIRNSGSVADLQAQTRSADRRYRAMVQQVQPD